MEVVKREREREGELVEYAVSSHHQEVRWGDVCGR